MHSNAQTTTRVGKRPILAPAKAPTPPANKVGHPEYHIAKCPYPISKGVTLISPKEDYLFKGNVWVLNNVSPEDLLSLPVAYKTRFFLARLTQSCEIVPCWQTQAVLVWFDARESIFPPATRVRMKSWTLMVH